MIRNIALVSLLGLTACANMPKPENIIVHRSTVVMPNASMYRCDATSYPNPKTLTDRQVAQLLAQDYQINQQCRQSLQSIKSYLGRANQITQ